MSSSILTSAFSANSTFDPYTQSFIILAPNGATPVPAFMDELLALQANIMQSGIIYGVQIGIALLLFVILCLMTQHDKRKSLVFLLNVLALILLAIRNILACCELSDMFYNYYNWQLHYYPPGPALTHAQGLGIAAEISNVFIDLAIYGSLVLQVHIVCCNLTSPQKSGVLSLSALVALVAVTLRLTLAIMNGKYLILGINTTTLAQELAVNHVGSAVNIMSVTSIAFFSAIFITKLARAIWTRHKLGMTQFGPMQIIFVMGCQTMSIPLIFAVVAYYAAIGAQLNSFVPTIVAVFLPLSGMWASANTKARKLATPDPREHRPVPVGASDLSGSGGYHHSKESHTSSGGTADTLVAEDDIARVKSKNHRRDFEIGVGSSEGVMSASETDLEMQQLQRGVVVDRSYSVRSED